jgi:hypothetical protein
MESGIRIKSRKPTVCGDVYAAKCILALKFGLPRM